ncbi:hypothetical protein AEA09_02980 [Lysinibacillus contaminans]|uniref:STAS domain-containing protein n=1 Tax=Lysinibacillus contaminans TaxID=1293441 RepID=A0ABR5JZQ6_9BACI|nr:hypothetical protein [Lysinibacillus contaminans]KOS67619.1 hypothetical protein AEA09_02980 [Lysinibacillus contaminans]
MSGKYKMQLNQAASEMFVQIEGSFTEQQAKEFIADYNRNTSRIQPSNFTLRLDLKDLNLVTQELVPSLESCFLLYKQSNFNNIVLELNSNPILKMQMNRMARTAGLTNLSITQG